MKIIIQEEGAPVFIYSPILNFYILVTNDIEIMEFF